MVTRPRRSKNTRSESAERVRRLSEARAAEVLARLLRDPAELSAVRSSLAPIRARLRDLLPRSTAGLRVYSFALAVTDANDDQRGASALALPPELVAAVRRAIDTLLHRAGLNPDDPRRLVALYALLMPRRPETLDVGALPVLWPGAHVAPNAEDPRLPHIAWSYAVTGADRRLAEDLHRRIRMASGSTPERLAPWQAGGGSITTAKRTLARQLAAIRRREGITYPQLAALISQRTELRGAYGEAVPDPDAKPENVSPRWVADQVRRYEESATTKPRSTRSRN